MRDDDEKEREMLEFDGKTRNTRQVEGHNNQKQNSQQGQVSNVTALLLALEDIARRQREHEKELERERWARLQAERELLEERRRIM